jgi:hemolysin activation/secretion protein
MLKKYLQFGVLFLAVSGIPMLASSAPLPGAADGSRVQTRPVIPQLTDSSVPAMPIQIVQSQAPPKGAKEIRFELKKLVLEGNHALGEEELSDLYDPFIGRIVTLDVAWVLAAQITDRYKQAGYFLSRAYVPAQTVDGGTLRIVVVEGFIETVDLSGDGADLPVVQAWVERLKFYRPIRMSQLEQVLLELNTLPDVSFRAVLNPPKEKKGVEGATQLVLTGAPKNGVGSVRIDNNGSKYLGPNQVSGSYEMGLIPGQKTSVSLLTSAPTNELQSLVLRHSALVAPQVTVDAGVSYTSSAPGYLLKVQEIEGKTLTYSGGAAYQWVRQRDQNFSTRAGLEWRDTETHILGTVLSRDKIRVLRLNAAYDVTDTWNGYNMLNVTLSQGLNVFNASKRNEGNLSRAQARPDFRKIEFNSARLQGLGGGFQAVLSTSGQFASGPLYSSEEFGYGGQAFGRAYDNSEIIGDHGLNGALELRYAGFLPIFGITPSPYAFLDGGVVWNDDLGQSADERGSSAGLGLRARSDLGVDANMGLAFPLSRKAAAPLYSSNGKAARFYFDLSYGF